ncbi:MAG TPA: GDP-mannose 4,6-dehydratase, partial [Bauldia sp.]|nr:GDP-mannose 4,6-dehydratase [Bauldia sp.]
MTGSVLVTGGAGFIGAYVCKRLLTDGWHVVVYDANPVGNVLTMLMPETIDHPRVALESGAITDGERLTRLCIEN